MTFSAGDRQSRQALGGALHRGAARLALFLVLAWVALGAGSGAAGAPAARRSAPGRGGPAPDKARFVPDDPLMNHLVERWVRSKAQPSGWGPRRQGPRSFVGYRLAAFDCVVRSCWYHEAVITIYPIAMAGPDAGAARLFRLGLGLEGGGERTLDPQKSWQHHQHLAGVISFGLQYPWRVTPFVDFVATLGAVHRNLYNKDFFDFSYSLGLDFGASIFFYGRYHVTGSVGWRRWVVRSDIARLYYDSLTITAGLGF